jgi:hypothetical protein
MIPGQKDFSPRVRKLKYRLLDRTEPARFGLEIVLGLKKFGSSHMRGMPGDQTISIAQAGAF